MFITTLHSTSQTGASRNFDNSLQLSHFQTSDRALQKDNTVLNMTQGAITVASDYSRNNQARTAVPQRRKIPTLEKIRATE